MVAADLVHPEGNSLVLVGVLALDHQHRDAVDEKDHVLTRAIAAVVKGPLLGHLKYVVGRLFVIDQDKVALAVLICVEELAPVAQVFDEFPVAVDVGVQVTESPEQCTCGLAVARVEFMHLGAEQLVEEQRTPLGTVGGWGIGIKAAAFFGFFARYEGPADCLGVVEDAGLDGFVFAGGGHDSVYWAANE